ncbi:MAG: glycosyltransferase family 39 protein [Parcubacteria group bacterium]|nr:glycosyltransferase family 39 protein [Parcubacteria group bacterium]
MDLRFISKISLGILLLLVFFIPFFSAQNFSPATDEITHLPSGYSYWKTGEITLNPQHPPLVKLLASFPLLFMDLNFDENDRNLVGPIRSEWSFGSKFLFSNDVNLLLLWGRLPIMLLSVLLAFYIYKWASEMFSLKVGNPPNRRAGFLALFLYAFMPNIIAHTQFVTTDLALASFSFITFYYLWKFFRVNRKKYLLFSGLFLGLALGSKFSATVFLPVVALFIFIYSWRHSKEFNTRIRQLFNLALFMAIPAFIVIYLLYFMPADFGFYLKGLKTVYADWKPDFKFYLNGQFSQNGWWYYFLEAFLIKTPIPTLIAFIASVLFYKKLRINGLDKTFIFLPMIFFTLVAIIKAQNIGIRYLIPAFPFLILYAGGLADIIKIGWGSVKSKITTLAIMVLAGWLVFSSLAIYPDYLAYFNELVGGPKNGYKYLDDSNIEWGQDLKRMAKYQAKNQDTKIIYSWKDSNPAYYGINNFIIADSSGWWREPKGRYAVNIFLLIRMQLLSEQRNDPALNWLALYKPIDRVGYSFFIYEF